MVKSRESKEDEKGMTKVKSYILSYLFPKAVNLSLNFLSPELTLIYLDIISQAQLVENHHAYYTNFKQNHYIQI